MGSQYTRESTPRIERHSSRMTEVRVHAAFKVKDESTFLKEAAKIVEATQAEQGCIHYQLYKEAGGQSGSYAMIETWATQVVIIIVIVILGTNPENKKAKQKQQTKEQTNATKKREAGHLGSYAMIQAWATQVNQLLLLLLLLLMLMLLLLFLLLLFSKQIQKTKKQNKTANDCNK